MSKKAIVTGGAGFIGSHIVEQLVERGYDVHSVDTYVGGRYEDRFNPAATYHELDVRDTSFADICEGADVVFHTAALPRVPYSIEHPRETADANVMGTVAALTSAVQGKVRRFVYSSSGSSYGNQTVMPLVETMPAHPVNPYGAQKYAGEVFANLWSSVYPLETVSLRYFNVYGPRLDPNGPYALAIGRFLNARKNNTPITIYGDGTVTRDFTHVRDVARANILAAESEKVGKGETINIGAGRNVTINYLASLFGGEVVYEAPRIEAHDSLADNTKAKELLGWTSETSLEEGILELQQLHGLV